MKLTAQIKLLPTPEQAEALRLTLERANAACDAISAYAWEAKTFRQYDLHHALYRQIKDEYALSAQVVVRCLGKVADSYKLDRKVKRTFREHGAIPFDSRILTYYTDLGEVSIWTLEGRQRMAYATGERQRTLLQYQKGESDLIYWRGHFYLLATCDLPDPDDDEVESVLGIDLGIEKLATDSDEESFSGQVVDEKREWYADRRAVLQSVGTKSAKRRLKQLSGRQRRFQKDVNHVISKRLVAKAKDTNRAIALEDLSGIRKKTTVRKAQRSRHSNWAFNQLRQFVTYKARLCGVPVVLVDPRNTSRTCSECGHCDKKNRKSQSKFVCQSCGHSVNADFNAAINIAARGVVNLPMVCGLAA